MRVLLGLVGVMLVGSALAQGPVGKAPVDGSLSASGRQWHELLQKGVPAKAKELCIGWETTGTDEQKLEAEKCLTDIALRSAPAYTARDAQKQLPVYPAGIADDALAHIRKGLALAPKDMTLNMGRLFVLGECRRDAELKSAFEETLVLYPSEESMQDWSELIGNLIAGHYVHEALVIAEVLYQHVPDSHEAAGNLGSLHGMLGEWDKALPYSRQAVELAPTDAIDTWDLGLALDHLHQAEEADKWLSASLKLPSDDASLKERRCLYGRFEVMERKQTAKGCVLVRSACPPAGRLPACGVAKKR